MVPDELSGGPYFAAFCERYLRHTKGRWSGRPLVFEDWQREFWWEALEIDPATGLRVYSEIGLGLPRKNGKSTIAAALGLYALVADGKNEPEVYVGANPDQVLVVDVPGSMPHIDTPDDLDRLGTAPDRPGRRPTSVRQRRSTVGPSWVVGRTCASTPD